MGSSVPSATLGVVCQHSIDTKSKVFTCADKIPGLTLSACDKTHYIHFFQINLLFVKLFLPNQFHHRWAVSTDSLYILLMITRFSIKSQNVSHMQCISLHTQSPLNLSVSYFCNAEGIGVKYDPTQVRILCWLVL